MDPERDKAGKAVECFKTDLMALQEYVSGQVTVSSESADARGASSQSKAWLRKDHSLVKATERNLGQLAQQHTVDQANLAPERSSSTPFEAKLLKAQTQSGIKIHLPRMRGGFFDASFQKSTEAFIIQFLDHVGPKALVFCTNISEHRRFLETTGRARHENICEVHAQRLHRTLSLHELGVNDTSAVGCSLGTSSNDGGSRRASTSLS